MPSSAPTRPPPSQSAGPSAALPRSFLWDRGLVEEVDVAFLPPHHFLESSSRLSSDAEDRIAEAQLGLIRSVGYLQAYRTVRNQYARSTANVVKLRRALSELRPQADAAEALKRELAKANERRSASEDELALARKDRDEARAGLGEAKAAAAEALAERDRAVSERDAAKAAAVKAERELQLSREHVDSVAEEFAQVRKEKAEVLAEASALEDRLATLVKEKLAVEEALAAEKAASKELADGLVHTAEACFRQALLQIRYFNPEVQLKVEGYSHRAFVRDDGSFLPAAGDPDEEADEPAAEADAPGADSEA